MNKVLHLLYVVIAVVFAAAPAVSMAADAAADKGGAIVVSDSAHAKATVVDINKKERWLTLRDEKGTEMVVAAGDEVRNFDQIKKGDVIEVDYRRAAASELKKVSDTDVAGEATAVQRAPAGEKPGMRASHTSTIIATVIEIDKKNRLLTVQGPKGGIVTVAIPADMLAFDTLKKGDKISAVYTEALAVSVTTPSKKK
jgi:hypothetical protein